MEGFWNDLPGILFSTYLVSSSDGPSDFDSLWEFVKINPEISCCLNLDTPRGGQTWSLSQSGEPNGGWASSSILL
jgi:hypothetical protein